MNTPQHTPGPWQIARPDNDRCRCDIETVERGVDLPEQGNHIAVAYWGTPTETANARLIASAPELLLALKSLLAIAPADDIGIDDRASRDEWMGKAHSAIARAEGSSSSTCQSFHPLRRDDGSDSLRCADCGQAAGQAPD